MHVTWHPLFEHWVQNEIRVVGGQGSSFGAVARDRSLGEPARPMVAAGPRHTVLLRSDGTVATFGDTDHGRADVPEPPAGMQYTAAAAGMEHTLLLRSDGNALAFGQSSYGETHVPELPSGLEYTAASTGGFHTVALRSDGTAVAWGNSHVAESAPACSYYSS